MNPFMVSNDERLANWRGLRSTLKNLTEEAQLLEVARWWGKAPVITYSIDYDHPDTWPTPWELIHEGHFCKTAIAYLMEQTLITAGWDADRLRLAFVRDLAESDQFMVLIVDNQYLLGYSLNEVFDYDLVRDNLAILNKYRYTDGKHEDA